MARRVVLGATAVVVALIGVVPVGGASAQARRDVAWYVANAADRAATLRSCRGDLSFARSPDCANAEMAETRLWARRAREGAPRAVPVPVRLPRRDGGAALLRALNDPATYGDRMFRTATLANCRAGSPYVTARECAAAARAGR